MLRFVTENSFLEFVNFPRTEKEGNIAFSFMQFLNILLV